MGFLLKEEKENLLIEYNLLREEIWERGYKTWVVNAILIIGSLLVAFAPPAESFPTPILSLVIIVAALILHATSERVKALSYSRLEEIAEKLRITGPRKMYESNIAGQWWYIARRNIAYVLLTILISIYLFLIFDNLYILAIIIVAGFLSIFIKEESVHMRREIAKVRAL